VALVTEFVEPPKPKEAPPPPPPAPPKQSVAKVTRPAPAPLPVAIPDPTPSPNAPTGALEPQPPAPPIAAPVAIAAPPAAPPAPPAPLRVELPSTDADYLQNPKPTYPAVSRRLGEQGKVVIHVLIGLDGLPKSAEVRTSSGFERLDKSALETVMRWRYVPGKRGGVPQAMGYDVPINFVLN
jgi:protein TonB